MARPSWFVCVVIGSAVLQAACATASLGGAIDEHLLRLLLQEANDGEPSEQGFGSESAPREHRVQDDNDLEWLDDDEINASLDYYDYLHQLGGWGDGWESQKAANGGEKQGASKQGTRGGLESSE
jgi:hypothetical protein